MLIPGSKHYLLPNFRAFNLNVHPTIKIQNRTVYACFPLTFIHVALLWREWGSCLAVSILDNADTQAHFVVEKTQPDHRCIRAPCWLVLTVSTAFFPTLSLLRFNDLYQYTVMSFFLYVKTVLKWNHPCIASPVGQNLNALNKERLYYAAH